ncbi:ABC transporter substrate-binding protein [Corynebacterium sp. HMSC076D02]|uniref:ABC transporter substrate-binding protein n=1 Tax=Corynebacterium sp. HMSC076D02 TaxID=1739439 RepID=UPI000AD3CB08|nr:ABC transporter substrate-binding protein [Corynebacterium sp. HMSC076D02]
MVNTPQNERHWSKRAAMALLAVVGLSATACSNEAGEDSAGQAKDSGPRSTDYFGYMVNTRLATTNAGTSFGSAANAAQLSSRLYPGIYMPGPSGQMIPNSDLVQTEEIPASPENPYKQVNFTLSEQATFSDGVPVTCDDYLLAYTAGVMPAEFGSHMPLTSEIAQFDCAPNAKKFTITFNKDQGDRWRYLFGPGTVMPAHAVAKKAGMNLEELNAALSTQDPASLQQVAETWRYGFSTAAEDFDPALQVSFGPFVVDKVGESGEVILRANEEYFGDQPATDKVVVWPNTADAKALRESGNLRVVDAGFAKPKWLPAADEASPYEVEPTVGGLTDTLTLSQAGVFQEPWARQAFAACIDQSRLAKVSSDISGVDVPPVYARTLRHSDPVGTHLGDIADAHKKPDMTKASELSGNTIKIGYLGPDERYAAMVEEIKAMCEPAGITVEDQSSEYMSQYYLEMDPATWTPTIDAFLGPVDPMSEYATPDADISNLKEIRGAEEKLWEDVPSIPVAAQPRVFIVDRNVKGVVPYTGSAGIGWNMDRWAVSASAS